MEEEEMERWKCVGEDTARTDGVDEREKQSAESARAIGEKSVFQPLDGSERRGV